MDKLKKQIFITLALLLLAAVGTLTLLILRAQTNARPEEGLNTLPEESSLTLPAQQTAHTPQEKTAPLTEDGLDRFLDDPTRQQVLTLLQTAPAPDAAYSLGMAQIMNKHHTQALSEIKAYKRAINELWQKQHPQEPAAARPEQPQTDAATEERRLPISPVWQNVPCEARRLPNQNPDRLTCRESEHGFCAFFENGRPYFCQTQDGKTQYTLNQWGSSVTVKQTAPAEKTFYYADGKLTRYTQTNPAGSVITQLKWNGNTLQMTQTSPQGAVLHKYYFTTGKPYVHYPQGNDMGEENGPWEEKYGQIWTDGRPLLTLPNKSPAPDICAVFPGACQTQAGQELL